MIQGERVRQARELHRMTQSRLVDAVPDLNQPRLSRIEQNRTVVSSDDLVAATLAAVTGVTTDWLSRPPVSELRGLSPHFRARSRTAEATKASGLAWAELVNEAHLELASGTRPLPVRLDQWHGTEPQAAARRTRSTLGFGAVDPLPYLLLAVERVGVRLLGLPWRAETVDAFCAWADTTPTIALSRDLPGDRLRWSVAHELGHLVLHQPTQQGRDVEAAADAFAAELLTPLDALRMAMPTHPTLSTLAMLKSQWGVSVKSLVRRARELGRVDDERALSLYRQISARGWNRAEPGFVAKEKPRALRKKVEIVFGRDDPEALARAMGWSHEMGKAVLDQHARADELPLDVNVARNNNVVSFARRVRA